MPEFILPAEMTPSAPLAAPAAPPAPRAGLVSPAPAEEAAPPAQGRLLPLLLVYGGHAGVPMGSWLLAGAEFCRAALEKAGGFSLEGFPEDVGAIRVDAPLGAVPGSVVEFLLERHRGVRALPSAEVLAQLEATRIVPPEACPSCRRKGAWRASSLPGRFLCGGCWTGWGTPADAEPPAVAPAASVATSGTWPEGEARPVPPETCPSCGLASWLTALAGNYLCGACLKPWGPAGAVPPEPTPDGPCATCAEVRWWRGADGRVRCGDCSPPGRLEVAEWTDPASARATAGAPFPPGAKEQLLAAQGELLDLGWEAEQLWGPDGLVYRLKPGRRLGKLAEDHVEIVSQGPVGGPSVLRQWRPGAEPWRLR